MPTYDSTLLAWEGLATGAPGPYVCVEQAVAELAARELIATRSGAAGKVLIDAATSVAFTDDGSPYYAYSGRSGSVRILAEALQSDGSPMVAGVQLGVPFVYCDVLGYKAPEFSIVAGLPALNGQRDSGFAIQSSVKRIQITGGNTPTWRTWYLTLTGSSPGIFLDDTGSSDSVSMQILPTAGGRLAFSLIEGGATVTTWTGPSNLVAASQPITLAFSFTDPLVGGMGYYAVWDSTSAILGSGSAPFPALSSWNPDTWFGRSSSYDVVAFRLFTSTFTDAQMLAFGPGGFPVSDRDLLGLRSSCYLSGSPLVLPIEQGGSGNVTAKLG